MLSGPAELEFIIVSLCKSEYVANYRGTENYKLGYGFHGYLCFCLHYTLISLHFTLIHSTVISFLFICRLKIHSTVILDLFGLNLVILVLPLPII